MDSQIDESSIPHEFLCPVDQCIMKDPVLTVDGFTFQRKVIEDWFARGKDTNPMTGQVLSSKVLIPNRSLKQVIEFYKNSANKQSRKNSTQKKQKQRYHSQQKIKQNKSNTTPNSQTQIKNVKVESAQQWDNQQFMLKYQNLAPLIIIPPNFKDSQQQLRSLGATIFTAFGVNIEDQSEVKVHKYTTSIKLEKKGQKRIIIWYSTGTFYFGQVQVSNNTLQSSGEGFQYISPNFIYEGQFKNNKRHGKGKGKWFDKNDVYSGQWFQGKQHGQGAFKGEHSFRGIYKDGGRQGYGKLVFKNGDIYEGQWLNNKFHGKGKFTWNNGAFHQGQYVNGLKSGKGRWLSNSNGKNYDIFEGNYENDRKHGYGVYKWINGTQYKGQYKNGKKEGQGTIKYGGNGVVQTGIWVNDQPIRK